VSKEMPTIYRLTFAVHLIVAVVIGALLLIIPMTFGTWFGYPKVVALTPVVRSFGALLLGFGGLTSFYARRATAWSSVDYIVRGEFLYLVLQTLVFLISALTGTGPALGNWVFTVVSAVLAALFAATWVNRPA
jgi:hypothetical protein